MTNFEKKIEVLFDLCGKVDKITGSVNVAEQRLGYKDICLQFKGVLNELESSVNIFGVHDLKNLFSDKRIMIKLFYVILKTVCIMDSKYGYFSEDMRSIGASQLAQKMMVDMQFYHGLRYADAWFHNDEIFVKGVVMGMKGVHKTSLQSIVRCIVNTFKFNEFKCQKISPDMQRFENCLHYFLEEAPQNERVFLDFI